jgi:glutamate synthase domain-containing protein 3
MRRSRCGISMKGIDIVVHGQYRAHVGLHGAGGQPRRLRRCGRGAGRFLYEARLFVRGKVKSLGADCVEKEMRPEHLELLADLLERAECDAKPEEFRRYGSARKLYNFHIDNAY